MGTTAARPDIASKELFGHPRGLGYLVFSEACERFSYYGMQALLVLYLTKQALTPGHIEHIVGFDGLMAVVGPIRAFMQMIVEGIISPFRFLLGPGAEHAEAV